jgi:hypothetical protein
MIRTSALLVSLLVIAGCGGTSVGETAGAEEAVDSTELVGNEASTFAVAVDGTETATQTASGVAAKAASLVSAAVTPADCETSTVSGSTGTFVFDQCTGPRGWLHASGTVVAAYSVDGGGIHAQITAENLDLNQAVVDITASATYSTSGGTKKITVATDGSGTGPFGNTVSRQGSYTATWTATCVSLDGTWTTTTPAGLTRSTTVSGYDRCQGVCPKAGGTIAHTGVLGQTITVSYDGSAVAHWSSTSGRSGTVQLTCAAN